MRSMVTSMVTWAEPRERRYTGNCWRAGLLSAFSAVWLLSSIETPNAAETPPAPIALEQALAENAVGPARITLIGGDMIVGRVVKIDDETLTIRRPSGGLRTYQITDIVNLKIKMADGELVPGKLTRLANGELGWAAFADTADPAEIRVAEGSAAVTALETGGPLVRLGDDAGSEFPEVQTEPAGIAGEAELAAIDQEEIAPSADGGPNAAKDETAGPIKLQVSVKSARESDKVMYFRLALSEPAPRSILIIYTMINGTAEAPGDYAHRQGTIVFETGQTQALVATSINNDELAEGPESFHFFVSGDPKAVVIENRQIAATIEDDDAS